jgi:hypothetical protein
MTTLAELIETKGLFGGNRAMGAVVSNRGRVLGVVTDIGENNQGVWIRRMEDDAGTAVFYSLREVELATPEELASAARWFLNRQYREVQDLRTTVKAAGGR